MAVDNITTDWLAGAWRILNKITGQVFASFDSDTITVPSGAKLNIATGGKLQNNGVDMDLSSGIATSTSSTTGELDTLHSVTGGTAAASKAVVLNASKGVTGLGQVGAMRVVAAASGDGAIAIAPKVVKITKAGVCAMTLADPASGDEGTVIDFIATTANAHTLDNSAGSGFFSSGGSSKDVATFGGAIGDRISVIALGTKWYILDSLNITLG